MAFSLHLSLEGVSPKEWKKDEEGHIATGVN